MDEINNIKTYNPLRIRRVFLIALIANLSQLFPLKTLGDDSPDHLITSREYKIKAGFLKAFTDYITWPEEELDAPSSSLSKRFDICLLGEDNFGKSFDSLNGKTVRKRRIQTTRCKTLDDVKNCQIVFISNQIDHKISDINQTGLLTIGESENFTKQGGIIEFYIDTNHVRFKINLKQAKKAGFKISSKLLRLSKIVE